MPRDLVDAHQRYEDHHRRIKLGELAERRESDVSRSFREVADEYLAWGNAQGGNGPGEDPPPRFSFFA